MNILIVLCLVGLTVGEELNGDVVRDWLAGHSSSDRFRRAVLTSAAMGVPSMAKSFASNVGLASNSGKIMSSGFNTQFTDACLGTQTIVQAPTPSWWQPPTRPPFWWQPTTTRPWWIQPTRPFLTSKREEPKLEVREAKKLANRDYVFVLDTSGSILGSQFEKAKEGIATLIESFCPSSFGKDVTSEGTKQVSVVMFGTTTTLEISFEDSHRGLEWVRDQVLALKHRREGGTSTAKALQYVKNNVIGRGSSRVFNKEVSTDVFVITDGRCNIECSSLGKDADGMRTLGHGVNVFALGVADSRGCELEIISGKGDSLAYGLGDFQEFDKFAIAVDEIAKENESKCT